jgi:hypothetical protein
MAQGLRHLQRIPPEELTLIHDSFSADDLQQRGITPKAKGETSSETRQPYGSSRVYLLLLMQLLKEKHYV